MPNAFIQMYCNQYSELIKDVYKWYLNTVVIKCCTIFHLKLYLGNKHFSIKSIRIFRTFSPNIIKIIRLSFSRQSRRERAVYCMQNSDASNNTTGIKVLRGKYISLRCELIQCKFTAKQSKSPPQIHNVVLCYRKYISTSA